ncbi:uncharacterized protein LOC131167404 [Malania oleifera]|uniref:uncharacterized protein LOC131167404 n=1 Tax=Malania oleifera TaxID=397392 RepID=UPI0025AE5F73|nr:uncharacterized protein LOC131167404 [Malania oleifera]
MPRIEHTSNRGSLSGRDAQNLDKWLVAPQAKLCYHVSLGTIDPILGSSHNTPSWFLSFQRDFSSFSSEVRTGLQNIKEKVTSLDQRITHIEKYQARSSRGSDPMDISSAPQSEDDGSDEETEDTEEGSAKEGSQEKEVGTKEEGSQEEEEEDEGQGDSSEEEG